MWFVVGVTVALWVEIPASYFGRIVEYTFDPVTLLGGMVYLRLIYLIETLLTTLPLALLHHTRRHHESRSFAPPLILHICARQTYRGFVSLVCIHPPPVCFKHVLHFLQTGNPQSWDVHCAGMLFDALAIHFLPSDFPH